ncbi:hypothetical protein CB0940_00056 [Cercospora beticola]|uniref:Uncharacterized protein n=1 Tax=Cercospora beticola TaxID=122368 RepID=A0A2G5I7E0_CERBT|nr:hypothetical protein CB0940_00056 [Cercospora beticola]PIB00707.1 hypothetical protein CB0940_00056 [Cercospora beticola]WPA95460.1 hypothetical protein RHO25_000059 [Cercospora beticola]CAK1356324.1 unnamed protein product [Cercospora beticola]
MHFTKLFGIALLPITSLAVPLSLSLSVVVNDASTVDFDHHHAVRELLSHRGHDFLASGEILSPDKYLGHLSEYAKYLTEASKILKDLKVPDDHADNDTWERFDEQRELASESFENATLAIDSAARDTANWPFYSEFNKEDTKTLTEALADNFGKVNQTFIDPVVTALKSWVFNDRNRQANRLSFLARSLTTLVPKTEIRCHFDNKEDDRSKDTEDDKVTLRNLDTVVAAYHWIKGAAIAIDHGEYVPSRHRLPASQWKLQL